jgi:hypothetical protein
MTLLVDRFVVLRGMGMDSTYTILHHFAPTHGKSVRSVPIRHRGDRSENDREFEVKAGTR